jgi:hypothetical protein
MSEDKNKAELRKLLGAMTKDEQDELLTRMEVLQSFADVPIHIRVHSPVTPDKTVDIRGRSLKDAEMIQCMRDMAKIRPELVTAKDQTDVQLLPDEVEKLHDVFDHYIEVSTRLPVAFIKQLGDDRTRYQLFKGIMQASQPSQQDLENAKKFRVEQRGVS